eukprot:324299-Hanusia_phi.AAC.1
MGRPPAAGPPRPPPAAARCAILGLFRSVSQFSCTRAGTDGTVSNFETPGPPRPGGRARLRGPRWGPGRPGQGNRARVQEEN